MSYKEDYNRAVFLNAYGHGKPLKKNEEYQRYFEFECEIANPRKYHKSLIKEGYLQPSTVKDIVSSLKVPELKMICDSLGIIKTGKKQELVDRIASSCSSEQLNSFINEQLYSLSKEGILFMDEHEDYVELHKHKNWGISLDEYVKVKQSLPFKGSFRDVAWGIFNKRIIEYSKQHGLLRNNYLCMSNLMKEENKHEEELRYLLYVLFFDICDSDINQHLDYCDTKEEALRNYDCFALKTSIPQIIANLEKYYNESYVDEIYAQYKKFPIDLCDATTFKLLIFDIFNDTENIKNKYQKILYDNYVKHVDKYFAKHPVSKRQEYEKWLDFLDNGGTTEEWKRMQNSKNSSTGVKKSGGCLTSILVCCLFIFLIMSFLI